MNEHLLSPALQAAARIYTDVMNVFLGPYEPPRPVAASEAKTESATPPMVHQPVQGQVAKPEPVIRDTYGRPIARTASAIPEWGPYTHPTGSARLDAQFRVISNTSGRTVTLLGTRDGVQPYFMALNPLEVDNFIEVLKNAKERAFKNMGGVRG